MLRSAERKKSRAVAALSWLTSPCHAFGSTRVQLLQSFWGRSRHAPRSHQASAGKGRCFIEGKSWGPKTNRQRPLVPNSFFVGLAYFFVREEKLASRGPGCRSLIKIRTGGIISFLFFLDLALPGCHHLVPDHRITRIASGRETKEAEKDGNGRTEDRWQKTPHPLAGLLR